MIDAWTDYPFIPRAGLRGRDFAGKPAPVRRVRVLSYDGDKYCRVRVHGLKGIFSIKRGYIYPRPGRCGNMRCIPHLTMCLHSIPKRFP